MKSNGDFQSMVKNCIVTCNAISFVFSVFTYLFKMFVKIPKANVFVCFFSSYNFIVSVTERKFPKENKSFSERISDLQDADCLLYFKKILIFFLFFCFLDEDPEEPRLAVLTKKHKNAIRALRKVSPITAWDKNY